MKPKSFDFSKSNRSPPGLRLLIECIITKLLESLLPRIDVASEMLYGFQNFAKNDLPRQRRKVNVYNRR